MNGQQAANILDKMRRHKWVRFINYRKEFPRSFTHDTWWPTFNRYWRGRIWNLEWRGFAVELDFRLHPWRDLLGEHKERPRGNA